MSPGELSLLQLSPTHLFLVFAPTSLLPIFPPLLPPLLPSILLPSFLLFLFIFLPLFLFLFLFLYYIVVFSSLPLSLFLFLLYSLILIFASLLIAYSACLSTCFCWRHLCPFGFTPPLPSFTCPARSALPALLYLLILRCSFCFGRSTACFRCPLPALSSSPLLCPALPSLPSPPSSSVILCPPFSLPSSA